MLGFSWTNVWWTVIPTKQPFSNIKWQHQTAKRKQNHSKTSISSSCPFFFRPCELQFFVSYAMLYAIWEGKTYMKDMALNLSSERALRVQLLSEARWALSLKYIMLSPSFSSALRCGKCFTYEVHCIYCFPSKAHCA